VAGTIEHPADNNANAMTAYAKLRVAVIRIHPPTQSSKLKANCHLEEILDSKS
jgi:hypothetical protein